MTNFQAQPTTKSLRWLTPERAVLVLPIAAGLLLSLALGSFVITPLSLRLQAKHQKVEALRQLRDELPLLEARLLAVNRDLLERREQQDQLLQLVAGVSELDTLLAELNDLAEQRGVIITRAEPGDIQSYQPPPQPEDGQGDVPPPAAGGEGQLLLTLCYAMVSSDDLPSWVFRDRFHPLWTLCVHWKASKCLLRSVTFP